MKMIRRTRITSMNGVTLISCDSAKSPSSSRSDSAIDAPIGYSAARECALPDEETWVRSRSRDSSRPAAHQLEIAFRHPGKMIVDDDGWNRRHQAERGRQQGFGDTRCDDS